MTEFNLDGAIREIREWLREGKYADHLDLQSFLVHHQTGGRHPNLNTDKTEGANQYYAAVWNLVAREILYPVPANRDVSDLGRKYRLTEQGRRWTEEEDGIFNCLPTEYGRYSEFLSSYQSRYGDGYLARSREAVGCYKAKLYLSCCVMCGAACESIILQIRIGQTGDETKVVSDYAAKQGLEKLINNMTHNRAIDGLVKRMEDIRELVKYWRNVSAHGAGSNLGEVEAFTALLLLLRFAHFVDDNWAELTTD